MSNSLIKVYINIPKEYWGKEKRSKILSSFDGFEVKKSKKASIGAGADGLLPSFDLLIILGISLGVSAVGQVTGGFLGAIGADLWEALKKALKKSKKLPPDNVSPGTPIERMPTEADIILWMQFNNASYLIHLPGVNDNWDVALKSLPEIIEETYTNYPETSRLLWYEGEWKRF